MAFFVRILQLLLCCGFLVNSVHLTTKTTYRAAVAEHQVLYGKSPIDTMLKNVLSYETKVAKAAKQGADIIVFPEYGITSLRPIRNRDKMFAYAQSVPDPETAVWNPCEENGEEITDKDEDYRTLIIRYLSCIARQHKITVVANLVTYEPCNITTDINCPVDHRFQFNTNVVFDNNGTLIARYHKYHLFNEPAMDTPSKPQYVTFDTGFAKFGIFTCFDVMWYDPAVKLVRDHGIRNIVFPTVWIDQLPFLTAIQAQAMWAYTMGVNLLAANCFIPEEGALGSGIYSSINGAVNYTYDPSEPGKIIIADVPIIPERGPVFDPYEEDPPILKDTPLMIDLGTKIIRFGPFKRREKRDVLEDTESSTEMNKDDVFDLVNNDTDRIDFNGTADNFTLDFDISSDEILEEEITTSPPKPQPTQPSRYRHYHVIFYESLENFEYRFLEGKMAQEYVCSANVCCILKYGLVQNERYANDIYALVAYNGNRPPFSKVTFKEQICAVVRCKERNITTCGKVQEQPPSSYFDFFRLAGNFTTEYVFPSVFATDLKLVNTSSWEFHQKIVRIPTIVSHPNSVRRHEFHNLIKSNIAVLEFKASANDLSSSSDRKLDPILTASLYGRPYEDSDIQK